MVAFALLRTSSILIGLLAPAVLANRTPLGHKTSFYHVPSGSRVNHKGSQVQVLSSSGTILHSAKVKSAWNADVQVGDGTNAYALWKNNNTLLTFTTSPISSLTTKWTVPSLPATDNDQVLFLFDGLYSTASDATLLPSLQYGTSAAGGGSYWSLVTWYILGDTAFYTTPVKVSVGDSLKGILNMTVVSDTSYYYQASFANFNTTTFPLFLSPPLAFDVAEERVEASGVTGPSDYPSSQTVFSNINLHLLNDTNPPVQWNAHSDDENGVAVSIAADGAKNAAITFIYPEA